MRNTFSSFTTKTRHKERNTAGTAVFKLRTPDKLDLWVQSVWTQTVSVLFCECGVGLVLIHAGWIQDLVGGLFTWRVWRIVLILCNLKERKHKLIRQKVQLLFYVLRSQSKWSLLGVKLNSTATLKAICWVSTGETAAISIHRLVLTEETLTYRRDALKLKQRRLQSDGPDHSALRLSRLF